MKTLSQEAEDEGDIEERVYIGAPPPSRSWRWRDRAGVFLVLIVFIAIAAAVCLGFREEFRIIGRLFR